MPASVVVVLSALPLVLVLLGSYLWSIRLGVRRVATARRLRRRARAALGTAAEAAEEEAAFSAEHVLAAVRELLEEADAAWQRGGLEPLAERPDLDVVAAWCWHHARQLGPGVRLHGTPRLTLLRVVNRDGEAEDRVVVRVRAELRRPRTVGDRLLSIGPPIAVDERWTLARHGPAWRLVAVDASPRSEAAAGPGVASAVDDLERLGESSLREVAAADGPGADDPGSLVRARDPAALALLDLSAVDGRFLPALLEASLTHLVEAWEVALTGGREALRAIASEGAVAVLLAPPSLTDGSRLALADARLVAWRAETLRPAAVPPGVGVALTVEAQAFATEEAVGAPRLGVPDVRRRLALTWRLALAEDDAPTQWRLVESSDPLAPAKGAPSLWEALSPRSLWRALTE